MPTAPGLTPDQQAGGMATPSVNVSAPVEAFGGAVGTALSTVGRDVEGAGDKIWARAVELQDLQNRTEVDKADSTFMEQAGLIHANFGALQGQDRAAAFPKYIQDLKDTREKIKGTLTNPMSQRMFDTT